MLKYFNGLSIGVGVVGGMIAKVLGGWDLFLKALIVAIILDYITGLLKGFYTSTLSSEIGYRGFIKKITEEIPQEYLDEIFLIWGDNPTVEEVIEEYLPQLPEPNKTEILEANVLNLQKLCIGLQKQIILK